MKQWTWILALGLLTLPACGEKEEPSDTEDDEEEEEEEDYTEFCDMYCNDGSEDIVDTGCDNETGFTADEIADCVEQCLYQTAVPECGELSVEFWQCTLDEYPGLYTCDENGNIVQPDICDTEQQAVLDCFNS